MLSFRLTQRCSKNSPNKCLWGGTKGKKPCSHTNVCLGKDKSYQVKQTDEASGLEVSSLQSGQFLSAKAKEMNNKWKMLVKQHC